MADIITFEGAIAQGPAGDAQRLKNGEVPSSRDYDCDYRGINDSTSGLKKLLLETPRGGMAHLVRGCYAHTGDLTLYKKPITFFGDGYALPINWAARFAVTPPTPEDIGNLGSILWNVGVGQHFNLGTPTSQEIIGDGVLRTWTLDNRANYITGGDINGTSVTFGEIGETGKDFYLGTDRETITQDAGGTTLTGSQVLTIYYGAALVDLQLTLQDMGFFGGSGVTKIPDLNTNLEFQCRSIFAMYCTGPAFELGATDVIGNAQFSTLRDILLYKNKIGILQHANCDLLMDGFKIYDQTESGIELRGANAKLSDGVMWGNVGDIGSETQDILVLPTTANPLSGATYNMKIGPSIKFGNEDSIVGEKRVKIRLGTAAQAASHPEYYITGLEVFSDTFIGTYPGPNRSVGLTSCIKMHAACFGCNFHDNEAMNAAFLIDDSEAIESEVGGNNKSRNNEKKNGISQFRSGGRSFLEIDEPKLPLPIENLVARSEELNTWGSFDVTITPGQNDPVGGTGACLLGKAASSGAVITQGVTASRDGPMMFGVFCKAGTGANVTFEVSNDGAAVVYTRNYFGLSSDEWTLCVLRLAFVAAGETRNIRIFPGISAETVSCNIVAFGAHANSGNRLTDYNATYGTAISGGRPGGLRVTNDLSIGGYVIDHFQILGTFAYIDLRQTTTGFITRLTLNNDSTWRIQTGTSPGTLGAGDVIGSSSEIIVAIATQFKEVMKLVNAYASLRMLQSISGTGFILGLNNDGTWSIQRTSDGGPTITDTPFLIESDGTIDINSYLKLTNVTPSRPIKVGSGGVIIGSKIDVGDGGDISGSGLTTGRFLKWDGTKLVSAATGAGYTGDVAIVNANSYTTLQYKDWTGTNQSLPVVTSESTQTLTFVDGILQ